MKKILLSVMAVAAIGFTSCGNKTQQGEAVDSVAIVDSIATGAAQETIDALSADIEAGDVSKLQATLESIKASVAQLLKENPEVAKEYVAKVQTFLKENADKIKAFAGDNEAINSAINSLTATPAESIVSGLSSAIDNLGDKASEAAEDAKKAAADKANEMKEDAKKKTGEAVDAAKDKVKEGLGI
jgi:ElaB/YqjD/DUF883 family membrane-anchored ribosome-binding protein